MTEKWIEIEKIVADKKVYEKGVEDYKQEFMSGKNISLITVVKHPKINLYAVLDGHHRFWAQKELGINRIKCVVIHDFVGPLFYFTKEGYLQPTPLFTKHVRVPFKKLKKFLEEFIREPEKLKKI